MLRLILGLTVMAFVATSAGGRQAPPNDAFFTLSTTAAGASAVHRFSFSLTAGDPELYSATISYAAGFRLTGFNSQGPAGSPIGNYELDADLDGVPERMIPIRSVSNTTAFIDVIPDDHFTPDLEPVLHGDGDATLRLRMPLGGDANADTRVSPVGARVTLVLHAGIIVNPTLGGAYPVVARMTTVDPDTDGPDDGLGSAPETTRISVNVAIAGPVLVPFYRLKIDEFDLRDRRPTRDRFEVSGRFVLGAESNGIDWRRDSITVSFASFSQTIPGSAFRRLGHSRVYHGTGPGVHRFEFTSDGRFEVDVRRLTLINIGRRPVFGLAVGDDIGSATVSVRHKKWDDD